MNIVARTSALAREWQALGLGLVVLSAAVLVTGRARAAEKPGSPMRIPLTPIWAEIQQPTKVATNGREAFVLSAADHSVVVVDLASRRINRRIGRVGMAPGDVYGPVDMSLTPGGRHLWVADRGNNRVSQFKASGEYVRSFVLKSPVSVAALTDSTLAVVATHDAELIRVVNEKGELIHAVEPLEPILGASPEQRAYLNRGFVVADRGTIVFAFRSLLSPMIRRYDGESLRRVSETKIDGTHMADAIARAKPHMETALATGKLSYSATLTSIALDPHSGHIWVTPAAPVAYILAADGTKLAEYEFAIPGGVLVAPTSVAFLEKGRGVLIAGMRCFEFVLPKS